MNIDFNNLVYFNTTNLGVAGVVVEMKDNENDMKFLSSYGKLVAIKVNGNVKLDERYYNFSNTTSKQVNAFLEMTSKERNKKIELGEIQLTKLI